MRALSLFAASVVCAFQALVPVAASLSPSQDVLDQTGRRPGGEIYDIQVCRFTSLIRSLLNIFNDAQAHRGGRGNTVENTLPSFAW